MTITCDESEAEAPGRRRARHGVLGAHRAKLLLLLLLLLSLLLLLLLSLLLLLLLRMLLLGHGGCCSHIHPRFVRPTAGEGLHVPTHAVLHQLVHVRAGGHLV